MSRFQTALQKRQEAKQEPELEQGEPTPPAGEPEVHGYTRMLGGRVPNGIFQEFSRRKEELQTERRLRRKVTTEQGIEALVRLLRDPAVREAWQREVLAVRAREQ